MKTRFLLLFLLLTKTVFADSFGFFGGGGFPRCTAAGELFVSTSSWAGCITGGTSGYVLTSNGVGSAPSWQAAASGGSGFDTIGSFGSSPDAKGASSSGTTITMQPADATHPGMVSTGTQTFAGEKTFNTIVYAPQFTSPPVSPAGNETVSYGATGLVTPTKSGIGFYRNVGVSSDGSDADTIFGLSRGYRMFSASYDNGSGWRNFNFYGGFRVDNNVDPTVRQIGFNQYGNADGGFMRMALGQQSAGTGTAGIYMINSNRWDITNSSSYGVEFFSGYSGNYGWQFKLPSGGSVGSYTDGYANLGYSQSAPTTTADQRFNHAAFKTSVVVNYTGGTSSIPRAGMYDNLVSGATTSLVALGGTLKSLTTPVGNVGSGVDTLQTYSIPASTLKADGQYFDVDMYGTFTATGGTTKQLICTYGATTVFDTGAIAISGASKWEAHFKITRTGATAQEILGKAESNDALFPATLINTTAAETLSGAVTLKCTGESAGGSPANNDVVQTAMFVKSFPPGN